MCVHETGQPVPRVASVGRLAVSRPGYAPRRPRCDAVRRLLPVLSILVSAGRLCMAADFYVSPLVGADDGSGRSPDAPFQSLARALEAAAGGDTIHLRSGLYAESVYSSKGSAASPLTIQPYGDEEPVITRGASESAMWMETGGMVLRRLRFTCGHLVFQNASHVRVEDCRFEGIAGNIALYLGGCHAMTLSGNRFQGNRHSATLVLDRTTGDMLVRDNQFTDNYPMPGETFNVILVAQASGQTLIASNTVCNSVATSVAGVTVPRGGDANAILVYRSPGVVLSGNTVTNFRFRGTNDDTTFNPAYLKSPEQGGEVGSGIGVVGTQPVVAESVTIVGNTIGNCSRHGIVCSYVNDSVIAANTVTDCGNFGIFLTGIQDDDTQVTGNLVADNLCGRNGWLHGGTSGISFIQVGPGNIMRRNFCFQNRQGSAGTVGYDWFGDGMGLLADVNAAGTIIENNLSVENEGSGIALHADRCVVLNNTLVGNGLCPHFNEGYGILVNGDMGEANSAMIVNNLAYNNRLSQVLVFQTDLAHVLHHNLFCAGPLTRAEYRETAVIGWGGLNYSVADWNAWAAGGVNGAGNLGDAPCFTGDTSVMDVRNFQLEPDSPGVVAGASLESFDALVGYRIEWDLLLAARDVATPAIGAFETPYTAAMAFAEGFQQDLDWMYTDWFGWVMIRWFPWIWKADLGFLYCTGRSTDGLWLYSQDMEDWFWTTLSVYPNLYSCREQAWLWYGRQAVPGPPWWFFNYSTSRWFYR